MSNPASKLKGKNVLVTGANGFIPSYVVEALLNYGANVCTLVRRKASNELENLKHIEQDINLVWGDIMDFSKMLEVTEDKDIVYHLAAQSHVSYSLSAPVESFLTNAVGTLSVLEACRLNDVPRMIHAGSAEQYGTPEIYPIPETHRLLPRSPYAAGKVAADRLMYSYWCTYNTPVVMPRFFNVFGPRQGVEKAIPKFITQIKNGIAPTIRGDGTQTRDFMFASDAGEAYALLGVADGIEGKVVNIGTGIERKIIDIANLLLRLMGSDLKVNFASDLKSGESPRLVADPSFLKQVIDWEPRVSFEEGMQRTIEFVVSERDESSKLQRIV